MSYIHEALRKAQEIKNRRVSMGDGGTVRSGPDRGKRYLPLFLPVVILLFLILAGTALYLLKPGEAPAPLSPSPPHTEPSPLPSLSKTEAAGGETRATPKEPSPLTPLPQTGPAGGETTVSSKDAPPLPLLLKTEPAGGETSVIGTVTSSLAGGGELYREALRTQQSGDLAGAETLYRRILKENPNFADGLNNLGVLLMARGALKEAEGMFRRAVAADGTRADPYYNMACLCSLQGRIQEGLEHLKKAALLKKDVKSWAKDDKDLENLRRHEGFRKTIMD